MTVSVNEICSALEQHLAAVTPAIDTAYPNDGYGPQPGRPYQQVLYIWAEPDNAEYGAQHIKQGTMQVGLMYPLGAGEAAAASRAAQLETAFPRGLSLPAGTGVVSINRTPAVSGGFRDGTFWRLPVRIRFFAHSDG